MRYVLKISITLFVALFSTLGICGYLHVQNIEKIYFSRESAKILDRNDNLIALLPNADGYYAEYLTSPPDKLQKLLLTKEDRYFHLHPGVNPISILKSLRSGRRASSTITLQLSKVLLGNEHERTWQNKIKEIYTALALEAFTTKDSILTMYINSVFLGNDAQGFKTASKQYYGKNINALSEDELFLLIAGISQPSTLNPFMPGYFEHARALKKKLFPGTLPLDKSYRKTKNDITKEREDFIDYVKSESFFEISDLPLKNETVRLTVDVDLTKTIREIMYRNMQNLFDRNAFNASVVVIDLSDSTILALAGSPNPKIEDTGYRVNMTNKPRQIGSTIKPFIYAHGFDTGLSPHTHIDDKELKYIIGSGYALYPKNFDYTYSGRTTLYHALSNSLNTPTVQVLEYIGVENFSHLLSEQIHIDPEQALNQYQLGLALGELEISILDLAHAFTLFPHDGILTPLRISPNITLGLDVPINQKPVFTRRSIVHINTILSDRLSGVDQFGSKNNLSLPYDSYGVKTGTTDNFRDSIAVGYTKDFLVAVWVGNTNYEPMQGVSGQIGAGAIWHDVMTHLLSTPYNRNSKLLTNQDVNTTPPIQEIIPDYDNLILSPHNNDRYLLEDFTEIPLRSSQNVQWYANDQFIGKGKEIFFLPKKPEVYIISAQTEAGPSSSIMLDIRSR